ncbi:MAG: redox-regulated ATPase YchF [Chloroflexi bacterium]|nr:redox-regulated ATPase YchF [Chloroflexota bacterium]
MFKSRREVPADIEYVDIAGVARGASQNEPWSKQFLNYIATADALLHVVRAFRNESVPHPEGSLDPLRDIELVDMELALTDLLVVQKRIDRLADSIKKTARSEREASEQELAVLERIKPQLQQGVPIRHLGLNEEEEKLLRGFQFLTAKPMLIVLNIDEEQVAEAEDMVSQVASKVPWQNTRVVALAGKLEMEMSQLDEREAEEFREALGVPESGLDKVIRESYSLVNLLSFFTAGEKESRAWTVRKGSPIQVAAGVIHSDMERGFIRAEVTSYDDLVRCGSFAEARHHGVLRLEGKGYIVQNGDVIEVLFSV